MDVPGPAGYIWKIINIITLILLSTLNNHPYKPQSDFFLHGRPKESQDGIENPPPCTMIVTGHGIKMKIMKAHWGLRGKYIYFFLNEDLMKINHELPLYVRKTVLKEL